MEIGGSLRIYPGVVQWQGLVKESAWLNKARRHLPYDMTSRENLMKQKTKNL